MRGLTAGGGTTVSGVGVGLVSLGIVPPPAPAVILAKGLVEGLGVGVVGAVVVCEEV